MKYLWILLLLAGLAQAADWSEAVWEPVYENRGEPYWNFMRGLYCAGDSLYLVMATADSTRPGYPLYHLYRLALEDPQAGPVVEEMVIPTDIATDFRKIRYAGVDRTRPAIASPQNLWQWPESIWEMQALFEVREFPDVLHLADFGFDSTGALHYLLAQGSPWCLFSSDSTYYRRRGGGRPDRNESFTIEFEYHMVQAVLNELWLPSANQVCFASGSQDNTAFFPAYYHLNFYASTGDEPFGIYNLGEQLNGTNPQSLVSRRGEWLFGYRAANSVRIYGGFGLEWDVVDWTYPTIRWRAAENPVDSTLEQAQFDGGQTPYTIHFLRREPGYQTWDEYATSDFPGADGLTAFHFEIDNAGRGHLFMLDSTTIWHYGPSLRLAVPEPEAARPERLELTAYPNPFNSTCQIRFSLPETGWVRLSVFDLTGRQVAELADGFLEAGKHTVSLEAENLPSCLYISRLEAGGYTTYAKLVLVK